MNPDCLRSALLLSLCAWLAAGAAVTEDLLEIKSVLGADCTLPCTAKAEPGVQYRAVRWYKVGQPPAPRLSGLLTRDLPDGVTQWYIGVEREVALLGESRSISLPNVTCDDSGVYMCHLAAPVGEQNRDGQVRLTLTDCSNSPTENLTLADAYMVIIATAVLMFALLIFIISYVCLRNLIRDRNKPIVKETLLDAPLRPLEKKDLMLICTLGPKSSTTTKHVCV